LGRAVTDLDQDGFRDILLGDGYAMQALFGDRQGRFSERLPGLIYDADQYSSAGYDLEVERPVLTEDDARLASGSRWGWATGSLKTF
jgi:hypothetical protein